MMYHPTAARNHSPPRRFPIVEYLSADVDDAERRELIRVGKQLLTEYPRLSATSAFGENVTTGLGDEPGLVIEDHSRIRLFELLGNQAYSYRGRRWLNPLSHR